MANDADVPLRVAAVYDSRADIRWRELNVREVPEAGIETKLDRHRCRNSSTGGPIGRNGRKLKTLAPLC
jgi:hypothetical protein